MNSEPEKNNQQLVVIDQQDAKALALVQRGFEEEKGLDGLVEEIRQKAKAEPFDISTKEGRKKMRSFAKFGIASSKTFLEGISDDLREEGKARDKVIRLETKRMGEEVDKIRDEFLKPLTDFEDAEKIRTDEHEKNIGAIENAREFEFEPTIEQVEQRLESLKGLNGLVYEEFIDRKETQLAYSEKVLTEKLEALKKQKANDEELAELKKEKEEREQKERDEKIAKDAADKATKDAEEKAEADAAKVEEEAEAEKVKAKELADAETARLQKIADDAEKATADAETKAEESAEAERKKIADEEAQKTIDAQKREDDQAHNKKINNEALTGILIAAAGISKEDAKNIVMAIARGEIRHVQISY